MMMPIPNCVGKLLSTLPNDIIYAVERGQDEIAASCSGDLDILTRKQDFLGIVAAAQRMGILISVTLAYGGARMFVGDNDGYCKRLDFNWRLHFKGIPLTETEPLLQTRDMQEGIAVLPEFAHATVVHAIKSAYGGAHKYQTLLKRHGYPLLSCNQRRKWLVNLVLRHPLAATMGQARVLLCYLLRLIWPAGLAVAVSKDSTLEQHQTVRYLFQNRVLNICRRFSRQRAHIRSELILCSPGQRVDMDLSRQNKNTEVPALIAHLKLHRTHIPKLLFWLT